MKKVLIIFAICAACNCAYGQTESDAFYADKPLPKRIGSDAAHLSMSNEFDHAEISIDNRLITFSGLPTKKKSIWALITNPEGESIKGMKVSAANNVMDIHKLHTGMYFVTLVYGGRSQKGFVIHV